MTKETTIPNHLITIAVLDKVITSLIGILEGIEIDSRIKNKEIEFLLAWLDEVERVKDIHPFCEIIPLVHEAVNDREISEEEKREIMWVAQKFCGKSAYFDLSTAAMQELQGILGGIVCDGVIERRELEELGYWLGENRDLCSRWPYQEVCTIVDGVMADGLIDDQEHGFLKKFFSNFVSTEESRILENPPISIDGNIVKLFEIDPDVIIEGKTFCFTGKFNNTTRPALEERVKAMGANYSRKVSKDVDYLVIGGGGNPNWPYACYGRKVEDAINLRRDGHHIILVHEDDFLSALLHHTINT